MAIAMSMLGIWLLAAVQLGFLEAFPGGAPSGACDAMIPSGHSSVAQTGDSLYDIKLSPATYCPTKEVTVTIMGKSNNGEKFRGFLCQARTAVDTVETSGSLTSGNSNMATINNCLGKASLSHADRTDKTSAVLKWTPNEGFTSSAFIVCTIVKEKATFWVKQNVELTYAGAANCTTNDNTGVCTKDEDCSGMDGKKCVDGNCTSVTIMGKSNNGEKFRGFLCQARTAVNTYETSGSLTSTGTKNDCSGKASLTHTDRTDKTSAVLKWTPNEGFTSSAFIVCTIVKEKTTFWVKQNVELTYAGAANCTDNMGVCNKDEDCSGMEGKQCVDGKCTSGAMRTVLVSLMLMVVCFVLTHF